MKILIAILNFVIASTSFADLPLNVLHCPASESRSMVIGCQVTQGNLFAHPAYETEEDSVEYHVKYDFSCSPGFGPDTLDIRVVSGDVSKRFNFGEIGEITINGQRPLDISDFDEVGTKGSLLNPNCKLEIQSVSVNPTDDQLKKWNSKKTEMVDRLAHYRKSAAAFGDLIILYPGYFFVKELAEDFNEKQSGEKLQSLRKRAAEHKALLTKMMTRGMTLGLTVEEVSAVANLQITLATLGGTEDWVNPDGSAKSMGDWLSPEDKISLEILGSKANEATLEGYKSEYTMFTDLALREELSIKKMDEILQKVSK